MMIVAKLSRREERASTSARRGDLLYLDKTTGLYVRKKAVAKKG